MLTEMDLKKTHEQYEKLTSGLRMYDDIEDEMNNFDMDECLRRAHPPTFVSEFENLVRSGRVTFDHKRDYDETFRIMRELK